MITASWNKRLVITDMLKSSSGLALCVWGALLFPLVSLWQLLFVPLCVLFGSYLASCVQKFVTTVTLDDEGISLTAAHVFGSRKVLWREITSIDVRSFPMSSFHRKHITDVKIRAGGRSLLLDDGLTDFQGVMQFVWRKAQFHGLDISEPSRVNLVALGCTPPAAS